jgi:hypothetical protein
MDMSQPSEGQPPQPTRSIQKFDRLIGTWSMIGTHPEMPNTVQGTSTFEWLREGALLAWHFDWEPDQPVPSAYSIIGHDDAVEAWTMLYTDERGVARIYQVTLADDVWKQWRDSPDFAQHMTATFSADGKTITWRGELAEDGATWKEDLSVTFTRQS